MPPTRAIRQHDRVTRRGAFPGSFNPLTIAHLEIAELARTRHGLDEVHLVVSTVALDKPTPPGPTLEERVALIEADLAPYPNLEVRVTERQLIADIAEDYDIVIMGADKWEQVNDEKYYDSPEGRDAALARLPEVVVATRSGADSPAELQLETPHELHGMSSTAARDGARHLMAPHAKQHWTPGNGET